MRTLKTKWFHKWAAKEGLTNSALILAVEEMEAGLIDANLGGRVFKKRVALPGHGKRGSTRTVVAYQQGDTAFFVYGFAKNERANISSRQLKAMKLLAAELLGYTATMIHTAIKDGELIEVHEDD